jgi:predicted dehydrogenase
MAKQINVGLIGSGFMGKAHSLAYASIPVLFPDAAGHPVRYIVCDVTEELAKAAAEKFGFEKWTTDWHEVINDPKVDMVDVVTPNDMHRPISVAAAEAGKHIFSEKPLALNAEECEEVYTAAKKAGIKNGMGFNYRKTPAIQYAKKLIEDGKIGDVYGFRGCYLNDWASDPAVPYSWRFQSKKAGSGVIGDQCTHVMDMARYLLGEIDEVNAWTKTLIPERPLPTSAFDSLGNKPTGGKAEMGTCDVDDACGLLVKFESGVMGMLEASRMARGRRNYISFEINGSKGSVYFNWERNNELKYFSTTEDFEDQGYRVLQMGPAHPDGQAFWPIAGIGIGFNEATSINIRDMINAIAEDKDTDPSFWDGWKIEEIVTAALKSQKSGTWEKCH